MGYYGYGNFGDEILMEEAIKVVKDLGFRYVDVLYAKGASRDRFRSLEKFDLFGILKSIFKSDAVFFGGGGILQDETSLKSFVYYSMVAIIAITLKKKVIFLGNGFGPIRRSVSKFLMSRIARSRRVIFFPRDPVSRRYLERIARNVRPGCDLAIGYLKGFESSDRLKRALVVPKSHRNWKEIMHFLERIGLEPVFLLADPRDSEFVDIDYGKSIFGLAIESIASSSLVVSERFHPALIASYFGVPFVSVGKKSSRYFKRYLPDYPGILENAEDLGIMLAVERVLNLEYDIRKDLEKDYSDMIEALSEIKF